MSRRQYLNLNFKVGDTGLTDNIIDRELESQSDTIDFGNIQDLTLAAGTVDKEVTPAIITNIRTIYIESEGTITMKLNSIAATGIIISKKTDCDKAIFLAETTATKVYVTNSGTSDINVLIGIIGD